MGLGDGKEWERWRDEGRLEGGVEEEGGWRRKGADYWRLMYGAYSTSGSSIFLNLVQIRSN